MRKDPLAKLDQGQYKAVTSNAKNILCLAGAGSGKTRVLTTRIFYLVKELLVKESNILSITFTKNAATEMKERLTKLGINTDKLWCCTFHSACYKILHEIEPSQKLNIIDEKKQDELLSNLIKILAQGKEFGYRLHRFCEENNWPMYLFREEAQKILRECKNRSISLKSIIQRCKKEKNEDVLEFYRLLYYIKYYFTKFLKQKRLYDFSDLILEVINILSKNKKLLKHYRNKFKYILVDEFQDVDFAQMKLLKLLNFNKNNLFAVGDDWQSIYGFRGGDVKYIMGFSKYFRGGSEQVILPYNYRSDKNIVRIASKFIRHNKKQQRKKIKAFNPSRTKLKIYRGRGGTDGIRFTINTIKRLLKFGVKSQDIMIIGRNWKNIDPYAKDLKSSGINNIKINSIHGAKGMEGEVVFIVGLRRGRSGFPNIKEDYDIVKLIKDANINDRLEEERRCMYVAITRAKKILFIITEKDNESIFVKELARRYMQEVK